MPPYLIAIILGSLFLLLVAAPLSIQIGGIVALITFFFGFSVLSIFRSSLVKRSRRLGRGIKQESDASSHRLQWMRHAQTLPSRDTQTADTPKEAYWNREMRQMIGVAGSISLVIGALTLTYVGRGRGDGIILIALAAI